MTTIALPQLKGHDRLTHSRMQCKKTCGRKHHYRYDLGIRPKVAATPLRMGAAVHIGLDARAKGLTQEESVAIATVSYEELPSWANTDDRIHEWMVERETVARLLMGYFWYWENVEGIDPALKPVEIVETEQSFDLPIRNPETGKATTSFRVAGKRDKIVRLADGRLAVMEHKTCGEDLAPESDYWKRLRIDEQISLYVLAAREEGHDVQTVLYDVIRKPSIAPKQIPVLDDDGVKIVLDAQGQRVRSKDGKKWRESGDSAQGFTLQTRVESAAEFGERLNNDIAERPTFYFARQEIPRLDADLDEFRHDLWQQQRDIRESQLAGRHFRNTGACLQYGRCEFFEHCATGLDPANLPAGFEQVQDIHPELQEIDS